MLVTTLIFDLGGVLVRTRWERFTEPVALHTGDSPEAVMRALVKGDAYLPFMRGEMGPEEFHRRLVRRFHLPLGLEGTLALWESVVEEYPGVGPLLDRLGRRYRLVLGSNTDVLHYRRGLRVQQALVHFQEGILSFRVGRLKPEPSFFRRGLASLGLHPQECLFVDDREENVAAAREVGLKALHFRHLARLEAELRELGIL